MHMLIKPFVLFVRNTRKHFKACLRLVFLNFVIAWPLSIPAFHVPVGTLIMVSAHQVEDHSRTIHSMLKNLLAHVSATNHK
jgi:hypothetical protein